MTTDAHGDPGKTSIHEVRVFLWLAKQNGWRTVKEIAIGAAVSRRTAANHAKSLTKLGIFDQAEVFPAHHFRVSTQAEKRNRAHILRLRAAVEVFGLS